jgi:hypothetical protein
MTKIVGTSLHLSCVILLIFCFHLAYVECLYEDCVFTLTDCVWKFFKKVPGSIYSCKLVRG